MERTRHTWEGRWSGADTPLMEPTRWRATRREIPYAATSSQAHLHWGETGLNQLGPQ